MSNETKRNVFDEVLDEWHVDETMPDANWKYPDFKLVRAKKERFKDRYDAALPDDLPVIPEAVGEHIRWCKGEGGVDNVSDAMDYTYGDVAEWLYDERNSDTFARAWVLGVWRVEETGEIVKLEEEK